jgi:hypothetical protein
LQPRKLLLRLRYLHACARFTGTEKTHVCLFCSSKTVLMSIGRSGK